MSKLIKPAIYYGRIDCPIYRKEKINARRSKPFYRNFMLGNWFKTCQGQVQSTS